MACTPLSQIYNSSDFSEQMTKFLDDWDDAIDEFEEGFDKATEDFQKKLDVAKAIAEKANCLPQILFDKNPALARLGEQIGYFLGAIKTIEEVKSLVRNSQQILKNLVVEGIFQKIPLPNLRKHLGGFFDALDKVNAELKFLAEVADASLKLISTLASTVVCLLNPVVPPDPDVPFDVDEKDPLSKFKEDYNEFLKKAQEGREELNKITDTLDLISNLFSGQGCIDITQ